MENYDLSNFEPAAKIVVIGVGGAGNNAVNRMIDEDIANVTFWVANTDKQALSISKSENRMVLGPEITNGLGAGGEPEIGEAAAEASADQIREIVKGSHMVFIAAGMGGGTGTGAAPVFARIAKDAGALVIAIVTRPFTFEGNKRVVHSIEGLNKLKDVVDSIIVVSNDKLLMTAGNAPISEAFKESDKVLALSVKTVVNLIMLPALVNLDFADVKATIKDSGVSLIGFGMGNGPNRVKDAANSAINCPLLEASISGARRVIVAITCGLHVSLYEAQQTASLLVNASGHNIDLKFGVTINDQLTDEILVSVIASDFGTDIDFTNPVDFSAINLNENINSPAGEETQEEEDSFAMDDFLPDFLSNK